MISALIDIGCVLNLCFSVIEAYTVQFTSFIYSNFSTNSSACIAALAPTIPINAAPAAGSVFWPDCTEAS